MKELPERDRKILDFEEKWGAHSGAKSDAIRATFGMDASRFYQQLNRIIDDPRALVAMPMLVKRLERERRRRAQNRASRVLV